MEGRTECQVGLGSDQNMSERPEPWERHEVNAYDKTEAYGLRQKSLSHRYFSNQYESIINKMAAVHLVAAAWSVK